MTVRKPRRPSALFMSSCSTPVEGVPETMAGLMTTVRRSTRRTSTSLVLPTPVGGVPEWYSAIKPVAPASTPAGELAVLATAFSLID